MSNPIDIQTDILSKISEYLYDSAPSEFEEATCTFEYYCEDDGSWSVGSKFSYTDNGIIVSDYLNDEGDNLTELASKLHEVMHSHTGGKWSAFTISVKNGGPQTLNSSMNEYGLTTGSNRSLRSLGRAKARPLTKRYAFLRFPHGRRNQNTFRTS